MTFTTTLKLNTIMIETIISKQLFFLCMYTQCISSSLYRRGLEMRLVEWDALPLSPYHPLNLINSHWLNHTYKDLASPKTVKNI